MSDRIANLSMMGMQAALFAKDKEKFSMMALLQHLGVSYFEVALVIEELERNDLIVKKEGRPVYLWVKEDIRHQNLKDMGRYENDHDHSEWLADYGDVDTSLLDEMSKGGEG